MNRRFLLISGILVALLCSVVLSSSVFAGVFTSAQTSRSISQQQVNHALAVTCQKHNCDGRSPAITGCGSDGQQLDNMTDSTTGLLVELVFSPTCNTKWAFVIASNGTLSSLYGSVERKNDHRFVSADVTDVSSISGTQLQMDSGMVYAPNTSAQACGSANGASTICTNFK